MGVRDSRAQKGQACFEHARQPRNRGERALGVRDSRAANATKRPRAGACSSAASATAAATASARASVRSGALSATCRASAATASALSALRLHRAPREPYL